ncbi:venom peptide CtAPI [Drosophila nasuta]|uniref:Venom peptide CtAPI n=1 Tax=Drosophila albomicans TaxID=7291 RepID=A0A6P8YJL8_DROAB|nr:venom peptide CtAPI [Drosophila albomicans]XP_060657837.1 venom peptide CtAPI [Drosophila nasuta]
MEFSAVSLGYLLAIIQVVTGHLHGFLNECKANDIKVDCIPECPRICMEHLQIRKCKPIPCTPGCACKEGWVRKGSNTGKCIRRADCKRWIL